MKNKNKKSLFDLAESQQGYFTTQQAEECSYSRSNFKRFLSSGEWIKELRGVYRLARYPIQDRPELVLWTLWSRNKKGIPQGVWSHETALDIHDLTDMMPVKMHMTVPKTFRRNQKTPSALFLHYEVLRSKDIQTRQGYFVTSPMKTLIDVANNESIALDQLELGVQQALKRGLITRKEIERNPLAEILIRYIP